MNEEPFPSVTAIRVCSYRPGDRLIVTTGLPPEQFRQAGEKWAENLREHLRAILELPEGMPIVLLARGVSFDVLRAGES